MHDLANYLMFKNDITLGSAIGIPDCSGSVCVSYNTDPIKPERIIFNDPATILFWPDGTKTVVKAAEDSEFNFYWGFCAAVAEKIFGSNHAVKTFIRKNCNVELDKQLNLVPGADKK